MKTKPSASNSPETTGNSLRQGKRPFDKKSWRCKKYKNTMGNVTEGQGYADQRKQIVMREYRKTLRKEKQRGAPTHSQPLSAYATDVAQTTETSSGLDGTKKTKKLSAFKRAQLEHQRQIDEKEKQRQEMLKHKQEREVALSRYKANKIAKMKRLSRRTRKGQPIMKDRMELLLEKIERQIASEH